jgi:hypothetical protein
MRRFLELTNDGRSALFYDSHSKPVFSPRADEQQKKLDEMTELYSRAMKKLSKRYFDAGAENWPRYDEVIKKALPLAEKTDRVCRDVLNNRATIEDFKHTVTVWFHRLRDGFKETA